jgi:hypothetical protein
VAGTAKNGPTPLFSKTAGSRAQTNLGCCQVGAYFFINSIAGGLYSGNLTAGN